MQRITDEVASHSTMRLPIFVGLIVACACDSTNHIESNVADECLYERSQEITLPVKVLELSKAAEDFEIELSRGPCIESCPVYKLRIDAAGKVHFTEIAMETQPPFNGRHDEVRQIRSMIPSIDKEHLWTLALSVRFRELPSIWEGSDCVTCASNTTISIRARGKENTVTFNEGCDDPTTEQLSYLGDLIDQLSGIRTTRATTNAITPELLDITIHRLGPMRFSVSNQLAKAIVKSPREALGTLRIVETQRGITTRFALFGIRRYSLVGRLGFQNGDVVESIDGQFVDNADKLQELIKSLLRRTSSTVTITRKGRTVSLVYTSH